MYTIIDKIDLDNNGRIQYISVGYTTGTTLVNEINKIYDLTLGSFISSNKTKLENDEININVFFSGTPYVYEARHTSNTIEGLNITEITNITQL
jgi:hypothetical protein